MPRHESSSIEILEEFMLALYTQVTAPQNHPIVNSEDAHKQFNDVGRLADVSSAVMVSLRSLDTDQFIASQRDCFPADSGGSLEPRNPVTAQQPFISSTVALFISHHKAEHSSAVLMILCATIPCRSNIVNILNLF